jgi:hypothetical protein
MRLIWKYNIFSSNLVTPFLYQKNYKNLTGGNFFPVGGGAILPLKFSSPKMEPHSFKWAGPNQAAPLFMNCREYHREISIMGI